MAKIAAVDPAFGEVEEPREGAACLDARGYSDPAADVAVNGSKKRRQPVNRLNDLEAKEWIGDVVRDGHTYRLARSPGGKADTQKENELRVRQVADSPKTGRAPRGSRRVSPETIAAIRSSDSFDEFDTPVDIDPAAAQAAARLRVSRWKRHQQLVTTLATRLSASGAQLHADPFDILAVVEDDGLLIEVKSLDGSAADERSRAMEALAQLLYYEAFVATATVGETKVHKVACFEREISAAHQSWLNKAGIACLWILADGRFSGDELARRCLCRYIPELAN